MITWVLLFIIVVLIVHYFVIHYTGIGKAIDHIPGPTVWPLLGNIPTFQVSKDELWPLIRKLGDIYYPVYRLWSVTTPMINVRHPDDIEAILGNTKFTLKSELYQLLEPWFGTGLLTSKGAKWQNRRKVLTPAFHFNVLQQFVEIFIEEAERMNKSLKAEGGPIVKNLLPLISEHTLNMICETAMGTSLQDVGVIKNKYRESVYEMAHVLVYRLVRPWLHTALTFLLVPTGWRQLKLLKTLHEFTKNIISERKKYHDQTGGRYLMSLDKEKANGEAESENDLGIRKRRLAMLDLLIAAHNKNQIDDEGIREEVDTFMFEGHDTTALSICYTIMLLAEHKEVQERARAEVNAVLQENGGKMSFSALQQLPYLERCIKESLRLYPSVHFISRQLEGAVRLSNYDVPAKTIVHIHIIDAHRDPNFWPEPEVFDPDRFLPEKVQKQHPYAYVPFSAGSRNCIGRRFAMLELKATIGLLLRNFYLEPIDYAKDVQITADMVLRPAHPIRTKFIPIE